MTSSTKQFNSFGGEMNAVHQQQRGRNNEELAINSNRVLTIQKSPIIPILSIPYMISEKGIVSSTEDVIMDNY
jgi:hypothetical protein